LTAAAGEIRQKLLITDEQIGPQADWPAVFGNDRPVQIEIGSGRGTTLMLLAKLFDQHNFLGIEWAREFYNYAARRIAYWKIDNVRMLRTDAREFIIDRVPTASVSAIHAYFPDPWPKERHHKRRLFMDEFCRNAARVLIAGGKILVATDHEEYFGQIRKTLLAVPALREGDADVLHGVSLAGLTSNYEAKFLKAGRNVFRLAAEKVE
jgi:tRNA (guanine-N7-)-methyltransferase